MLEFGWLKYFHPQIQCINILFCSYITILTNNVPTWGLYIHHLLLLQRIVPRLFPKTLEETLLFLRRRRRVLRRRMFLPLLMVRRIVMLLIMMRKLVVVVGVMLWVIAPGVGYV